MPAYKDKNNWRCTFYYENGGVRKKKNKRGFKTKKEAQEWEREFLLRRDGSNEMTFGSLVQVYLDDCKLRYKINTFRGKEALIKKWFIPYFGNKKIQDINISTIREWQNELLKTELKASTVKMINSNLKVIFQFAVDYMRLLKNPVVSMNIRSSPKEKKILTEEQFNLLLSKETKAIYRNAMIVLYWTGIRAGELFALTVKDFDFDKKKMRVNKSIAYRFKDNPICTTKTKNGNRVIDINDIVIEAIKEVVSSLYNPNGRIFEKISSSILLKHIQSLANSCGLEGIGVHTFRHSHASYLFSKGVNVLMISKRLGHANISTTLDTYTHALTDMEEKLLSVLE